MFWLCRNPILDWVASRSTVTYYMHILPPLPHDSTHGQGILLRCGESLKLHWQQSKQTSHITDLTDIHTRQRPNAGRASAKAVHVSPIFNLKWTFLKRKLEWFVILFFLIFLFALSLWISWHRRLFVLMCRYENPPICTCPRAEPRSGNY
jgi:hypothetical protein